MENSAHTEESIAAGEYAYDRMRDEMDRLGCEVMDLSAQLTPNTPNVGSYSVGELRNWVAQLKREIAEKAMMAHTANVVALVESAMAAR